jgi:hypothetical protein
MREIEKSQALIEEDGSVDEEDDVGLETACTRSPHEQSLRKYGDDDGEGKGKTRNKRWVIYKTWIQRQTSSRSEDT